jgi:hypothetical protein
MIGAIDHLLTNRDEVRVSYLTISASQDDSETAEAVLYGPVTTGLYACAIAETVMYAEDLFVLLHGLRVPERFVQQTINYPGGKVPPLADRLSRLSVADLARAFFVPTLVQLGEDVGGEFSERFADSLTQLARLTGKVVDWWRSHRFMQQQYKHGMALALSPFGNEIPESTIAGRKQGAAPPIYAFDAEPLTAAVLNRSGGAVMSHYGTGAAISHAIDLSKERNFLRYAAALPPVTWSDIVQIARAICNLQKCVLANRAALLPSAASPYTVYIPTDSGRCLSIASDSRAPGIENREPL